MFRTLSVLAAIVAAPPTAYVGCMAVASARQGFEWRQMDWNGDQRTSLGEFLAAADIREREVCQNGRRCTEFYSLKDGLPIRTECR